MLIILQYLSWIWSETNNQSICKDTNVFTPFSDCFSSMSVTLLSPIMCDCFKFIVPRILETQTPISCQDPQGHACHRKGVIALYPGDSWTFFFQLYYLNCPGKYVQRLYYQFIAPLATPLIQQLKYSNQRF